MTVLKRFGFILLAVIIWLGGIELGERLSTPGGHSFVSTAEAIVGRPLTPVSVCRVGAAYSEAVLSSWRILLGAAPRTITTSQSDF